MIAIDSIMVDQEFESLLPSLSDEEFSKLKESVSRYGFLDPIVVWLGHGVIVDGHNRYKLWLEMDRESGDIPEIVEMRFADRDAVKQWIFEHQISRRNLTAAQKVELALRCKAPIEAKAKEKKASARCKKPAETEENGEGKFAFTNEDDEKPVILREEIAKATGVSPRTVTMVKKVLEEGDEQTKAAMLSPKTSPDHISINEAHQKVVEPKRDKRTTFNPADFDPHWKAEAEETVSVSESRSKFDKLLTATNGKVKAAFESLGPLVRALDDANSSESIGAYKSLMASYERLYGELEQASTTVVQLNKVWSSVKK